MEANSSKSWQKEFEKRINSEKKISFESCSTKQAKFSEELKFFEDIARWVEYKDVPVEELEIEVQSFLIPKGTGRLKATRIISP